MVLCKSRQEYDAQCLARFIDIFGSIFSFALCCLLAYYHSYFLLIVNLILLLWCVNGLINNPSPFLKYYLYHEDMDDALEALTNHQKYTMCYDSSNKKDIEKFRNVKSYLHHFGFKIHSEIDDIQSCIIIRNSQDSF